MLSVAYFSYLARRAPDRFPDLARAMGEKTDGLTKKEKAFAFIKALRKLIRKIGLAEERLSSYGVKREDLRSIAENSFYTMRGLYSVTPVPMKERDVVEILEEAYA
jgi:alcohol dehydrogenase